MLKGSLLAALGYVAFAVTPALADDSATSGPKIDGTVELTVTADQDVDAAIGNESKATQELGDIDSGTVDGNITSTIQAGEDVSASIGNKSCTDQKIGTIGGSNAC